MKSLFVCLICIFFLSSCTNEDKITSNSFNDVDGVLYYEKPVTGSVVYAVFLPFVKKNAKFNLRRFDCNDYKNGIKFGTANGLIKDKLYSVKHQKFLLKSGGEDHAVYLLSNVKIYFHIDKPTFQEENVIEKDLQLDTLVCMNKHIKFKYNVSWITIDSIKAN
jgi:hypothetical protein